MIKLNEQEMDEVINRAIEKFCDDHVPLYDGPYDPNLPGGGYIVPYYAKSTLRKLCIRLIVELCEAESEKVKGESYADVCCDPSKVKCPHCGCMGVKWDEAKEWCCISCGRSLPDE